MSKFRWMARSAAAFALLVGGAQVLSAQGVTTGAVSGTITDEAGAAVEAAQVQVVNRATGTTSGSIARAGGRFTVPGLEVGTYNVTVRRIGYVPQTKENVAVTLSQATRVDFALVRQVQQLAEVQVTGATTNSIISPTKTGVGTTIRDSTINRLPSLNRNFVDFVRTSPQVSSGSAGGGASGGGVNGRLNNIQIDGASSQDVFGLNSTGGQPGAQANGKIISLEAVKEIQVLLSPFDVRQGNFNGLLVNAVTKTGTNAFHGSAVVSSRNEKLARDIPFIRNQTFTQTQYDFSFGGPIVKNKAFFFLAPSIQQRQAPATGPYLGQSATNTVPFIPQTTDVDRFTSILQSKYGIDAGSVGKVTNDNPLSGLFGRLDFNLPSLSSRLVLRDNYSSADQDNFSRSTALNTPTLAYNSQSYVFRNRTNQAAAQFFTNWSSGASNEFILGYNRIRDKRDPSIFAPQITVDLRPAGARNVTPIPALYARLVSGTEASSQANQLDQDIFEFTDNFSKPVGAHTLTIGTKNEFYKIRNLFAQNVFGTYTFFSLDSLEAGNPSTFTVGKSQGADPAARFKAGNYSGYVQDVWQVSTGFNLSYGLRVDVPVINDKPFYNPVIDTIFGNRFHTNQLPSGNFQYSPRIGFNWDVTGDQRNQLRGGVGAFAGRPSFVFVSNAFGNTGAGVTQLTCGRAADVGLAPAFVSDINNQPGTCVNRTAGGPPVGITGYQNGGFLGGIATINDDFRYPQSARASLGFDRAISPTLTMTLEGLYTHAMYQPFYTQENLRGPQGVDRNGRVVYGNVVTASTNNGQAQPLVVTSRLASNLGLVNLSNQSKDYSYNLTGQLDKRFESGLRLTGSYTYSRAYDVQTLTSDVASSNFRFGRTVGTRANTEKYLGRSAFDVPHRILVSGAFTLPTKSDISVIYDGHSGQPFDYVYGAGSGSGDLNADGVQGNDLIYVPTNVNDTTQIRFQGISTSASAADQAASVVQQRIAFNNFIERTKCLREQRGQIMERNSCRNPWQNVLDASFRQSLPSIGGHTLSVQLDVFNFLNLLNENWGERRFAGSNTQVNLLTHQRQVAANGSTSTTNPSTLNGQGTNGFSQGVFTFTPTTTLYNSQNVSSNYQLQLGARYSF